MRKRDWYLNLPVSAASVAGFWYLTDALIGLMWLAAQVLMWNVIVASRRRKVNTKTDQHSGPA